MYDDNAKKLGVKVIAKVESNNAYDAINYNDPITVGVVQWFGTRATNLLNKMRVGGTWSNVAASLDNNLRTVDQNNPWWNSRYLTNVEGESLRVNLTANEAIQNEQIIEDFDGYKQVAISYGFDPDTNTETVLFFFCMHHQSPASALRVVQTLQTTATLDQIYAATMADSVLGQYVNRYTEARDMIRAGDNSGVELPGEPTPEPPPVVGGGNETGSNAIKGLTYVEQRGSYLSLHFKDGDIVNVYSDGRSRWVPGTASATEPVPPVDPEPPVDPPEPTGDWAHPLPTGIITSPWGPRGWDGVGYFHYGTDWSTPGYAGTCYAVTDMVITWAGEGNSTAGTYVKGHSIDGLYTFCYYHMVYGSLRVRVGDTVLAGAPIGTEGATGNVTGRHLHFEVYEGTLNDPWPPPYGPMTIDPVPLLASKGVNV